MTTFKLTLAYDGTDYVGWQRQASGTSIQQVVEDALSDLDRRPVPLIGAGRTDAGVHAVGQVASCSLRCGLEPRVLRRAINARLPRDIRVLSAELVADGFHARHEARRKTYCYRIWNGEVLSPFERRSAWHVSGSMDLNAVIAAAAMLEGRHDFAGFQAAGGNAQTTVRTVTRSRIFRTAIGRAADPVAIEPSETAVRPEPTRGSDADLIVYEITGDGFLRHMVRAIVGTLVEIGRGRWSSGRIGEVLAARDRALSGPTAPPHGLFLVSVEYGDL
jgi:tRNA pseudouridine38-40 synthase